MSETIKITDMITELFVSRNQLPVTGLVTTWTKHLKGYDIDKLALAFVKEIKYGDNFPSLPRIIKVVEDKQDSKTEATQLWQEVIKQSRSLKPSSANLSDKAKWLVNEVCGGLTTIINADEYTIGSIERDFKGMFNDYDSRSTKMLETPVNGLKSLGLDTDKIGVMK